VIKSLLTTNDQADKNTIMNKHQKTILRIAACILGLILIFPPFYIGKESNTANVGYSLIVTPPIVNGWTGQVNIKLLLSQVFIVVLVFGLLYFAGSQKDD